MSTHPKSTVLVVDDEKTIRDALEYNLRREGYHVLTAWDGEEAIRLAHSERISDGLLVVNYEHG